MQDKAGREIALFLALTLALSLGFWVFLALDPERVASAPGAFSHLLMACPGVAALLTRWTVRRTVRGLGWGWPGGSGENRGLRGLGWLGLAFLLPMSFAAAYGLAWATGVAGFDVERFARAADAYGLSGAPVAVAFPALLVGLPLLGLAIDWLPALGEELGWRGLLLPRLAERHGFTRASLWSGLVWAAWHLPLIVLLVPRRWPDLPVAAAALFFSLGAVGLGFVLAWLTLKTASVWPAVVLHASTNIVIQGVLDRLVLPGPAAAWLLGEHGFAFAVIGLLLGWVFWRQRHRLPEQGTIEAPGTVPLQ